MTQGQRPTAAVLPTEQQLVGWSLDPAWSQNIQVDSHDGGRYRWHLLDTGRSNADRGTIVCVHGNPTWAYAWATFLRQLSDRYRVVAIDQLGMGYSERPGPRRFVERVADLTDIIGSLSIDRSRPLYLAAHDWGGAITMGWAVDHQTEVSGIVLCNTGIAVPDGRAAPALIRLAASRPMLAAVCHRTPTFVEGAIRLAGSRIDARDRDAFRAPYRTSATRRAIAEFVGDVPIDPSHPSATDIASVADKLPTLQVPVMLAWGAADPVFNDDFADDLAARLPSVVRHRFPTASHLVMAEADVAGTAGAWLDQLSKDDAQSLRPRLHGRADAPPFWIELAARGVSADTGDTPAIVDLAGGDSLSFRELVTRIDAVASSLVSGGLRPGDRVAMLTPPGIDLIAAVYGVWRAGGVTVIADRGLGLRGLGAAVRSARPDWVIGPPIALRAAAVLRWAPAATRLDVNDLVTARVGSLPPLPDPDDTAAILFTSGATGPAKGVRYRYRQLYAQLDALRTTYTIGSADRLVAAFAPFALYGPALGITTALPDCDVTAPATLSAEALGAAVTSVAATMVFASPSAIANVIKTADGSTLNSLRSVRLVMTAGAPVPAETLRATQMIAPNAQMHTPYGMTEALPVADIELTEISSAEAAISRPRGVCVGRPVAGARVRIVQLGIAADAAMTSLATDITGEILVNAPWVSAGYNVLWATEHHARPTIDGEVWHRSGDVGHLDSGGRLWIEGRAVHVIHTLAGPITPVPIERAVERALGVLRAAAVGVGPVGQQQLVVVVEDPDSTARLVEASVAAAARAAVDHPIAAVISVRQIPVDIRHNAKIDRRRVADWAERLLAGKRPGRLR